MYARLHKEPKSSETADEYSSKQHLGKSIAMLYHGRKYVLLVRKCENLLLYTVLLFRLIYGYIVLCCMVKNN